MRAGVGAWIAIWPMLMRIIGLAKVFMGRAAETEGHIHEAFRLSPRDINCLPVDACLSARPRCSSVRMPKPSVGYDEASRPTAIILSPIFCSPLPWAARRAG